MVKYPEITESVDINQIKVLLRNNFAIGGRFKILPDGSVDVVGRCELTRPYKILPIKFNHVSHTFSCVNNHLTSLVGSPVTVGEDFRCGRNKLTSLEGAPKIVGGGFYCRGNALTSLVGLPDSFESITLGWSADLPMLRLVGRVIKVLGPDGDESSAVHAIFRKYEGKASRSNIIACQNELIAAGFEGNAKW